MYIIFFLISTTLFYKFAGVGKNDSLIAYTNLLPLAYTDLWLQANAGDKADVPSLNQTEIASDKYNHFENEYSLQDTRHLLFFKIVTEAKRNKLLLPYVLLSNHKQIGEREAIDKHKLGLFDYNGELYGYYHLSTGNTFRQRISYILSLENL